jgi:hypothetical protein
MTHSHFPLAGIDADGRSLAIGSPVVVLSVASCVTDLPIEDQDRLAGIVGQVRQVIRFDEAGFVWLSFVSGERNDDFCLFPREVRIA